METSVLRSRPIRALLAAEVISTTGMQMTWVALPWFVVALPVLVVARYDSDPRILHAIVTLRIPPALRPTVMTGLMTLNALAMPIGILGGGAAPGRLPGRSGLRTLCGDPDGGDGGRRACRAPG